MTLIQACIAVLIVYIGMLMGVGIWSARRTKSASDFIIGGRTIGPWVTALSFIAVYFSSVLIIGGGAFGYKFGMSTIWIGAINVLVGCTLCWIVLGRRVREMTERLRCTYYLGILRETVQLASSGNLLGGSDIPVSDHIQRQRGQGDGQCLRGLDGYAVLGRRVDLGIRDHLLRCTRWIHGCRLDRLHPGLGDDILTTPAFI